MRSTGSRQFAAFDIDGTLVRWQFFHAIVHELGKRGYIDAKTHQAIRDARMQWKRRTHSESFKDYEAVLVSGYLAAMEQISEAEHAVVIDGVFEEYKDQLFTYTRDKLAEYKQAGRLIFAISGSHQQIVRKLAEHLGIDDYIGAELAFEGGKYTGIGSTPIRDKAAALRQLVDKHGATFDGSVAIGDSESDIAMLAIVEHPIAFNPSHGLFTEASQHHWDIVVERKNVIYRLQSEHGRYILTSGGDNGVR